MKQFRRTSLLIERVVTVTGKDVASPSNFLVRIGTPVTALIEAAGGLPERYRQDNQWRPHDGKGSSIHSMSPVTKALRAYLLYLKMNHYGNRR
jgi:Na+-translocating ferredoxin:NAD+ oxidoreductase subunit C